MGVKAGLFRPISVWPFPYTHLAETVCREGVKAVLDVEVNEGQMIEDVKLAINGAKPWSFWATAAASSPPRKRSRTRSSQ